MTYEQALNFNQKWNEQQAFNDLERYLLRNEPPAYKALALGMKALKKQIPQKPLSGADHYASWRSCPVCHSKQHNTYNYCTHCGQALDWGKE